MHCLRHSYATHLLEQKVDRALAVDEFIRWFLLHVLPGGFHRIHHYGMLANASRKDNLVIARQLG
jgi:hypothetical protein